MPEEPQIKSLSYNHRKAVFALLVVIFLVALPAMIFYTTGYRLDFNNETQTIVTTGGMYITTDNLEVTVYLDGVEVEQPRLFRRAYYIQNIEAGQHRVVVQRPDLITWVKELPVDAHIVIEAAAFNMPAVPQVRPITEYVSATGTPTYVGVSSTTDPFLVASSTVPVTFTARMNPVGLELNEEFIYVESLFGTTSTSTQSVFERLFGERERFRFATTSPLGLTISTSTDDFVERGDMRIVERGGELYARWLGTLDRIPFYFCVVTAGATTTAERYGQHVADQIEALRVSTSTPLIVDGSRTCRPEIKLDRLRKDVYFYDFYPNNQDLILLQLEDGLYVTEIDDRAWQNVQLLYPGTDFQVVLENGVIYVKDHERYFEIVTTIEPS